MWFLTKRKRIKEKIQEENEKIKKRKDLFLEKVNSCNGTFIRNTTISTMIIDVIQNICFSENILMYDIYYISDEKVERNHVIINLTDDYIDIRYLIPASKEVQDKIKEMNLDCVIERQKDEVNKEITKRAINIINKLPKSCKKGK
jgi:hypothetical protein